MTLEDDFIMAVNAAKSYDIEERPDQTFICKKSGREFFLYQHCILFDKNMQIVYDTYDEFIIKDVLE